MFTKLKKIDWKDLYYAVVFWLMVGLLIYYVGFWNTVAFFFGTGMTW